MGYNEAYLNLLSQQAARRAQNLRDVANIGAQAQMASAEAWGRVPGTLAAIGTKFAGDVMDYRAKQDQNRIQEDKNKAAAAEAKTRTAVEMWKIGAPYLGRVFETVTVDNWPQSRAMVKDFADSVGQGALVDKYWPEQHSPQAEQQIKAFASVIGEKGKEASELTQALDAKARSLNTTRDKLPYDVWMGVAKEFEATKRAEPKPEAFTLSPGGVRFDATGKQVASVPAAPKTDMTPQPMIGENGKRAFGVYDPAANKLVPVSGGTPIPPQAASSQGGQGAAGIQGFVLTAPPDAEKANTFIPGGTATNKAVWENAFAVVMEGPSKNPYNSRSADPKIRTNATAIDNTASGMVRDGATLPLLRAEYAMLNGGQKAMFKTYLNTSAFVDSATQGIQQLQAVSDSYPRENVPVVNDIKLWWNRNLKSDANLSELEIWVFNASRDYAKATSGSAGSVQQMTDAQIKASELLLSLRQGPAAFLRASNTMLQDMRNQVNAQRAKLNETRTGILNLTDTTFGKPWLASETPQAQGPAGGRGGAAPPPTPGGMVTVEITFGSGQKMSQRLSAADAQRVVAKPPTGGTARIVR